MALASGDFVFVGDVGRPDLLETAAGAVGSMEPAARSLYRSIQADFRSLPEYLQVWPAHGAGSACGKSLGDIPTSTVGYELRHNPAIGAAADEGGFVRFILSGQPEPPPYFARMKRDNRRGPNLLGSLPVVTRLETDALHRLAGRRDLTVLDTRGRGAFFEGHLPGSILADLDYHFCTIAGSFVEEGARLFLIVDETRLDEAVRSLVRIGLDQIEGYATPASLETYGRAGGVLARTETVDMKTLERQRLTGDVLVLDVRGSAEFGIRHVPGALNIAHTRLLMHLADLPRDRTLLVHCASGSRSAASVSVLERYGFRAIQVNDLFTNYQAVDSGSPPSTTDPIGKPYSARSVTD
jgi:hydroxyacylglutathione hydrolase